MQVTIRFFIFCVLTAGVLWPQVPEANGTTYRLADSIGPAGNPNGPWVLMEAASLREPQILTYGNPNIFGSGRFGWALSPGTDNPCWTLGGYWGMASGVAWSHGPALARWIAPAAGTIDVTVRSWKHASDQRDLDLVVLYNGTQILTRRLLSSEVSLYNQSHPLIATISGAGVQAGDRLDFANIKGPGIDFDSFLAVDVTVDFTPGAAGPPPAPDAGREYHVNGSYPGASDNNAGTEMAPLLTIMGGVKRATAGDTITIHGGTYRQAVLLSRSGEPNRPITLQAAAGEDVLIKGSDIIPTASWKRPEDYGGSAPGKNAWAWPAPSIPGRNPAPEDAVFTFRREQVFLDGQLLKNVPSVSALEANSFTREDATGLLYLCLGNGDQPAGHTIEVSTRESLLGSSRQTDYVTIRRLRFSHGANDPESKGVNMGDGHHWLVEDVESTWLNGAGLRVDRTDHCILRRITANYNGCTGISGGGVHDILIENCVTHYNNQKLYPVGWESGGIKMLTVTDSLITDHRSRGNKGFGIWLDWTCSRNRITRSILTENTEAGVNIEASRGPTWVDNCIMYQNGAGVSGGGSFFSAGLYSHDGDNLRVVHNLSYMNHGPGVRIRILGGRTNDQDGLPVCCHNNRVANNLLLGNDISGISLPADGTWSSNNSGQMNIFSGDPAGTLEEVTGSETTWNQLLARMAAEHIVPMGQTPAQGPTPAGMQLALGQWQYLLGSDTWSRIMNPNIQVSGDEEEFTTPVNVLPWGLSLTAILNGIPADQQGQPPWPAGQIYRVGPFALLNAEIVGDINRDGCVNLADVDNLAGKWLMGGCASPGWCLGADVDESTAVDVGDLAALAGHWLQCGSGP